PPVLPGQVADLALADADVTRRDVGVFAEVAAQFGHERLAEPHHLEVAAALRVEVRPTFRAADRHAGQGILEDLLEAEELHDPQVHARVEPQPTLVRTEHGVELHAEPTVHLDLAGVIDPGDAEDDLSLRLAQPLDHAGVEVLRFALDDHGEAVEHLLDGL